MIGNVNSQALQTHQPGVNCIEEPENNSPMRAQQVAIEAKAYRSLGSRCKDKVKGNVKIWDRTHSVSLFSAAINT